MTQISWSKVYSLGGLNAAIAFSWIAYHEFQPSFIQAHNLENLVPPILIAKMFILIFIPVIAGFLADRYKYRLSTNMLVYTIGISATAIIFMLVASFISIGEGSYLRFLLPALIILWLIAMNIFHAPASSLLELFIPERKLPLGMAVLVFITELIYALEPLISTIIQNIGAGTTFFAGGILIAVSGYLFLKTGKTGIQNLQPTVNQSGKSPILAIIGIGLLLGIGHALLRDYAPLLLNSLWISNQQLSSVILLFAALMAIPTSYMVMKISVNRALVVVSPMFIMTALLLLVLPDYAAILAFLLAILYAFLNVSGLPFIFREASPKWLVTTIGIYFGSSEVFDNLIELYFQFQ